MRKHEERRFIEILKNHLPDFPSGEISESESPDFTIGASDENIGIEITKIHQEKTLHQSRRQESEQRAVVDEALQVYETKCSVPVEVKVHFSSNSEFNKGNRRQFASAIADLVLANLPLQDGPAIVQNHFESPDIFPYEIDSLSIYRLSTLPKSFWSVPSAGFVQENFTSEMEAIIAKKDRLISNYRPDCAAFWLLIVAEGNSASTFLDPSPFTLAHRYHSSFDRIFFLEAFRRKVAELMILPALLITAPNDAPDSSTQKGL